MVTFEMKIHYPKCEFPHFYLQRFTFDILYKIIVIKYTNINYLQNCFRFGKCIFCCKCVVSRSIVIIIEGFLFYNCYSVSFS